MPSTVKPVLLQREDVGGRRFNGYDVLPLLSPPDNLGVVVISGENWEIRPKDRVQVAESIQAADIGRVIIDLAQLASYWNGHQTAVVRVNEYDGILNGAEIGYVVPDSALVPRETAWGRDKTHAYFLKELVGARGIPYASLEDALNNKPLTLPDTNGTNSAD